MKIVSLNFNLRNLRSREETPIRLIIRRNCQRRIVATKLKVHPKYWDLDKQAVMEEQINNHKLLNDKLEWIKDTVSDFVHKYYLENETLPSIDQIKILLANKKEKYQIKRRIMIEDECLGVYFLIKNGRIQYIGHTTNIARRISQHRYVLKVDFDSYCFEKCEDLKFAKREEKRLIKKHKPPLNIIRYKCLQP